MTRRNVALVGLVAAACAVATVSYRRVKHDGVTKTRTAKVDRGRIAARATATGSLSALVTVQVGSQVSGRLQAITVDFGSPVKKGQVIARIDPALFRAAAEQARANRVAAAGNLAKAAAQAAQAERHLERSRVLAERRLIAAADLDAAQSEVEVARAAVASARGGLEQASAALNQARVSLAYTTIVSPINGVVISRNVDVGQTVAASLQSPTLFTIAEDLRQMQVHASVAESDVGKLRPGMPVTFTVDAYPGERFGGDVRQIRDAPQLQQNVVTYDAVVDVANPGLRLKPGMTASVTFVCAERDGILRVPATALRFRAPEQMVETARLRTSLAERSPGQTRTVWALRGGAPTEIPVEVGLSDGTRAELVSGDLHEGDTLITEVVSGGGKASSSSSAAKKPKGIF